MKRISLIVLVMFGTISLFAQQKGKVIIKGTITGDLKGYDKMYMYTRMSNDSAVIGDAHYTFTFPFNGAEMRMFVPEYVLHGNMSYRPFGILIDRPGTYSITTDVAKGMYNSEVKGSEAADLYRRFGKEQDEAYSRMNKALATMYGNNWYQIGDTDPKYEAFKQSQDSLQAAILVPVIEKLVKQHPNSAASTFVLSTDGRGIGSLEKQEQLYNLLSPGMKKSKEGTAFHDYIEGVKNSSIGKMVKNFTLPDQDDQSLSFSRFKGKYLLIDFWASWCVPCRQSFPKMRRIYQQYKDKGFEIYSISIDQDKAKWLQAVREENNPWQQALDTKDISQKGFAVTAVPTSYLVNPEGKIVAKQVGFDDKEEGDVEKKLDELYGPLPAVEEKKEAGNGEKKVIKFVPAAKIQ